MGSPANNRDDFELMRAIAAGDASALAGLYDRHSPLINALCRRILKDPAEAEGVLFDIFFELWSRADRYDPSRGAPLSYIITLARSRAIDSSRTHRSPGSGNSVNASTESVVDYRSSSVNPLESSDLAEQCKLVREALTELDPEIRRVLECSFYEGLSHSQIAEKLGKPLGTVKTYIRQGLIRLRQKLRIDDGDVDQP